MFSRISTRTLLRLCAVLVIPLLMGGLFLMSNQAQAAPDEPDANPHPCTISDIAVFDNRIHVRCSNPLLIDRPIPFPDLQIYYFAAAGDEDHMLATNRYLTLLNTAFALGKPLDVGWVSGSVNNPPGCLADDCRGIAAITIRP